MAVSENSRRLNIDIQHPTYMTQHNSKAIHFGEQNVTDNKYN